MKPDLNRISLSLKIKMKPLFFYYLLSNSALCKSVTSKIRWSRGEPATTWFAFEPLTAQTYLDFVLDIVETFISSRKHITAKSCSWRCVTSGSEDKSVAAGAPLSVVSVKQPVLKRLSIKMKRRNRGVKIITPPTRII